MAAHRVAMTVKVREEGKRWVILTYIAVADSPGDDGMSCNCAENQVCLRTGRFGITRCVDRKSACSIPESTA